MIKTYNVNTDVCGFKGLDNLNTDICRFKNNFELKALNSSEIVCLNTKMQMLVDSKG